MKVDLGKIFTGFGLIINDIACKPIQNIYFEFINTGVFCVYIFIGMYECGIWISKFYLFILIFIFTFI